MYPAQRVRFVGNDANRCPMSRADTHQQATFTQVLSGRELTTAAVEEEGEEEGEELALTN